MTHSHTLSGIFCHLIHQLTCISLQMMPSGKLRVYGRKGRRKRKQHKSFLSPTALCPSPPQLFFLFHQRQHLQLATKHRLISPLLFMHVAGKSPVCLSATAASVRAERYSGFSLVMPLNCFEEIGSVYKGVVLL